MQKNLLLAALAWGCLSISGLLMPCAHADDLAVSYGLGTRTDGLRWAIASDFIGTPPNIASELTWRNLKGVEQFLELEYTSSGCWMGRAKIAAVDFNQGGEMQDSDFLYDNRNGEFSRSLASTHGSSAQDATLIIGCRLYRNQEQTLTVTPIIGLSRNITDLRMNNGVQTIPASGAYAGLNSSYRAQMDAKLTGIEARWWFSQPFGLDMKWHHSWFNYYAEADWNIRADFQHPVSFYQDGKGEDDTWTLGLLARINKVWAMELSYSMLGGSFQNGKNVANLANGSSQATLLREAQWSSTTTSLLLNRTF